MVRRLAMPALLTIVRQLGMDSVAVFLGFGLVHDLGVHDIVIASRGLLARRGGLACFLG